MRRSSPNHRWLPLLAGEAALAAPALGLIGGFQIPLADHLPAGGLLAAAVVRGVVATLPPLALLAWMLRTRWRPAAGFRRLVQRLVNGLLEGAPIGWLIAISIAAGVGEELLFRGALQPLLISWLGPWCGVATASLLFGLAHPISRTYAVIATAMGLYLGALAFLSGEIVSAMVAHALYDFVAILWLRRSPHPTRNSGNHR